MNWKWLSILKGRVFGDRKTIKYSNILIFISALFAILFSFYSILKAYTINAYAWDLGLYSQAFYSSIHGQLFYTSLLGESYLAEHFSPFMFLLVPFFYIYPSPYTLLVIQAVFISFASVPLYYISLHIFSNMKEKYPKSAKNPQLYAFIVAIAFLLSPLTESPIYFDFHLMIFLPFFYFISIYFYLKKRILLNILFLALIVSLHSSFVFIAAMTLLMEVLISRYYLKETHIRIKNLTYLFLAGLIVMLMYYTVAGYLKGDIAHSQNIALFVSGASGVATKSIFGLLVILLFHPYMFIKYLLSNYKIKLLFLLLAFMAVDFAFYRFIIGLLPAIPYLVYAMTSSYIPYYFMGFQYSMMFIPIVFIAGVFGISKMMEIKPSLEKKSKRAYRNLRNTMIAITTFAIAAFIIISPISPLSIEPSGIHNMINESNGHTGNRNKIIYAIEENINVNSSLVTGNNIFPIFYKDMNATAFPYNNISSPSQHFKYLIANFNDSQTYIKNSYNISLANLASDYMNSGSYGIFAEGCGIIALELNYSGNPIIYKPFNVSYSTKQFIERNGTLFGPVPNNSISSFQNLENTGANIYSGNTTYFLPGNYSISILLNNSYKMPSSGINITIFANNGKITVEHINSTLYRVNGNKLTFNVNTTKLYIGVIYSFNGIYSSNSIKEMSIYQQGY